MKFPTSSLLALLTLSLTKTSLAQSTVPSTYRKVYITSMVDAKYVVVPKTSPAANGASVVVYVSHLFPYPSSPSSPHFLFILCAYHIGCTGEERKGNEKRGGSGDSINTINRQTLTSKPEQQWYITANTTKIYLASNTTLCLDAGAKCTYIHTSPPTLYRYILTNPASGMERHGKRLHKHLFRLRPRPTMDRHARWKNCRCGK